jgi:hypothetical protein
LFVPKNEKIPVPVFDDTKDAERNSASNIDQSAAISSSAAQGERMTTRSTLQKQTPPKVDNSRCKTGNMLYLGDDEEYEDELRFFEDWDCRRKGTMFLSSENLLENHNKYISNHGTHYFI